MAGDLPPGLPLDNCFLTMLAMFTSRLWEMSSTCTTALHRKAGLELEVERHNGLAEAQELFSVIDCVFCALVTAVSGLANSSLSLSLLYFSVGVTSPETKYSGIQ